MCSGSKAGSYLRLIDSVYHCGVYCVGCSVTVEKHDLGLDALVPKAPSHPFYLCILVYLVIYDSG